MPEAQTNNTLADIETIIAIALNANVSRYRWRDRGVAPAGYIKGMAVAYASAYCEFKTGDITVSELAKADTGNISTDALAWYSNQFSHLGMDNSVCGVDTLRHLFVLLTGLGMRESSGKYCEGRDRSAKNTTGETAEAGLFQTSYNATAASPILPMLLKQYAGAIDLVEVFQEGVSCKDADLENFGEGEGREFQRLTKACPAFAVKFAAVGLRNVRKHWGPINTRAAEIRPECDMMFSSVQEMIEKRNLCGARL